MADLTTSQINTQTANQSDLLVEAFKQTQQYKLDTISTKKKTLEDKQVFFNQLKTKIDNLQSAIDGFAGNDAEGKFVTRTTTSSDTGYATTSADSTATIGINNMKVNRLATNDMLIAKQLKVGTSDLFGVTGDNLTFKVNGVEVSVNLASGISNENAMKAIVTAINAKTDAKVSASYIKDTSSTGRLTLTSTNTGTDNKISFDDNGSGVLNQLGLDNVNPNATDRTATQTGSQYAHYKISNSDNLNSAINLNGIDITRGSNTITDVLQGVTINLLKTQDSSATDLTLTTASNPGSVEGIINPLLNKYNELITYLKNNPSSTRSEAGVSSLNYRLRSTISQAITSGESNGMKYLTDIGIKINSDGTLSIGDSAKLADKLKEDPKKVSSLFVGTDSFTDKLKNAIGNLVGDGGLIASRKVSLRQQIESSLTKTKDVSANIDKQAEALRKEYTNMLKVFLQAQQQYNTFTSSLSY